MLLYNFSMNKAKSFLKETIETLLISGVILFILLKFFIYPCRVDGTSMYPTLHDNDIGHSFIITKNIGVNRFDICVIKLNDEYGKKIVKRVIGMPNETIEYKDNVLYIDGVKYEEDYLKDVTTNDFSVKLNDDEYFCLGDNRNNSKDSRYYGAFSKDMIISTHVLVLYPFNNFGVKK